MTPKVFNLSPLFVILYLMQDLIRQELIESAQTKSLIAEELAGAIEDAADLICKSLRRGGKVLIFGNGGSAADAQHFACELVGKFKKVRKALPAVALTTDTSILTAVTNDFDFKYIFSRQIEALGKPEDVAVAISTSGNSPNVLEGIKAARDLNIKSIGLSGKSGGKLAQVVDIPLLVPSVSTPRIQEGHIAIIHILCLLVERSFFGE